MEYTEIHYRSISDAKQSYTGPFYICAAGVVIPFTERTQAFVPWHKIDFIEQSINPSGMTPQEVINKRLSNRIRNMA